MNNILTYDGVHSVNYDLYIGSASQLWNGSAFVNVTNASWTTFAIAGTEQDATGRNQWTMPAAIPASPSYSFAIRQRASTNPDPSDPAVGAVSYSWDGTNLGISILGTNGLDSIIGEPAAGALPSLNMRQLITLMFDACCYGILENANLSPISIYNPAGTVKRATIAQDQFGNRLSITLNNIP